MVYSYLIGFLSGLCVEECLNKTDDYFLKPVVCIVVCGTASAMGMKVAYDNVGPAYDRISSILKPIIKGYFSYKTGGALAGQQGVAGGVAGGAIQHLLPPLGNLPPVVGIAADIARNRGRGF